ncbi:DUF4355 domain-containing protein [Desulfosporosinus youngiae]|uniref:DUF4355 domain-containing protein n=1 Tax=Desulfosporosinus youngiae DSM 17734 TaxID=768710 RepID=H5Y571_9FIRM|nr:DUF4355 domain-containing protein [Desulfosporosinus youngiae]EHQ90175.1 hypothetical protein DesyoDRAFT_3141 [Desulfosporosinus youngiae DSM 17734]
MDLNEVKSFIEQNAQNEEVRNYIGGFITPDRVNSWLETEDGKKLIQPKLDQFFSKGLETWKTNNLEKLVSDEVAKRNPSETPEQKQIRELTERLNKKEAEEKRQSLMNKGLLEADKRKLPKEVVSFFLGEDEEATTANLTKLEEIFNKHITDSVEQRLKGGYKPPAGGKTDEAELLKEQIRKSLNGEF